MASATTELASPAVTRLLGAEVVGEGTMAFHFARPPGFRHRAGQNMLVTLVDPPQTDSQGPSRTFTIASAPHEDRLTIATRMRDTAFKRVLKSAAPGLEVHIDGPAGVMVLHEDAARPAVFLAGGIGITPFLAIARDVAHRRLPHQILLLYANRRPQDAAYLDELRAMKAIRLVPTLSEPPAGWKGETGFIDRAMIERHLPDRLKLKPVYYFAGPPAMAMAMQSMLAGLGVADADLRSEEFYGY